MTAPELASQNTPPIPRRATRAPWANCYVVGHACIRVSNQRLVLGGDRHRRFLGRRAGRTKRVDTALVETTSREVLDGIADHLASRHPHVDQQEVPPGSVGARVLGPIILEKGSDKILRKRVRNPRSLIFVRTDVADLVASLTELAVGPDQELLLDAVLV